MTVTKLRFFTGFQIGSDEQRIKYCLFILFLCEISIYANLTEKEYE